MVVWSWRLLDLWLLLKSSSSLSCLTVWLIWAGTTSSPSSSIWRETCTSSASSLSAKSVLGPANPHHPTLAPRGLLTSQPTSPRPSCRHGLADGSACWWLCCTATRRCCLTCWRTAVTSSYLWTGWGCTQLGRASLGSAVWRLPSCLSSPSSTHGSNSNHDWGWSHCRAVDQSGAEDWKDAFEVVGDVL